MYLEQRQAAASIVEPEQQQSPTTSQSNSGGLYLELRILQLVVSVVGHRPLAAGSPGFVGLAGRPR